MSSCRQERLMFGLALSDRYVIGQIYGSAVNRRRVDCWHNYCA